MSRISYYLFVLLTLSFGAAFAQKNTGRTTVSFNKDWKFYLGDAQNASSATFNDGSWRILNLPHDWSIEGTFSESHPAKPEGGGLPTGIAWYRKHFSLPASSAGKSVYIDFDGIYQHSEVWVNGNYVGKRPNGYVSFRYDISRFLKFGNEKNVIAVKVDNSAQPNSRWYSGSGIYRNVWLVTTENVHVDHWGTFITTTQVTHKVAPVMVQVAVKNKQQNLREVEVRTSLYDPAGKRVCTTAVNVVPLRDTVNNVNQYFDIQQPKLWSVDNPHLYKAVTEIYAGKQKLDSYETTFGARFFEFHREKGFFLNGKPLKILGVNNHHDLGALGAAVNVRAMERQLEILKAMGCNAIRTAHNPPAPELLDLCDRMGFIVMDETFDMWRKKKNAKDYHLDFPEWHERDLADHVKRDRNHPSVFMWSIGNEIREQFDSTGIAITKKLAAIVKGIDPTRPVTSALTEMNPEKNFLHKSGALDIYGFNYNHHRYDSLPHKFIKKTFIASETTSGLQTRGHYDVDFPSDSMRLWPKAAKEKLTDGNPDWTVSAYDHVAAFWGSTHEQTWKAVKRLDFMAGLYVWTGFDYLGEPVPYEWPARSSYFGIIDLAGFPKDVYYMYQSEWTNKPVLHIFPHWNWQPGKTIDVWAYYNNADEVELFLNGRSLGVQRKTGDDLHVKWPVQYEPGVLKAVSRKNGKEVLVKEIKTAGQAAKIELTADRKKIKADGKDLSFVTVRILDADGNLVPDADHKVDFILDGQGFIAGVDNGYQASMEPFKANYRKAFKGMCLAIIQSKEKKGSIRLKASSPGLEGAVVTIKAK